MEKNIQFAVRTVSPELAEAWLSHPSPYRSLSFKPERIVRFVDDLQSCHWCLKMFPIIIDDTDGTIYDGRKRLKKIIKMGRAVSMLINYIPKESI